MTQIQILAHWPMSHAQKTADRHNLSRRKIMAIFDYMCTRNVSCFGVVALETQAECADTKQLFDP